MKRERRGRTGDADNLVVVLFEVIIKADKMEEYLSVTEKIKEHLAGKAGFIRSERFSSLAVDRKLLSLSIWESEEAVAAWRNTLQHREAQKQGRSAIFESYTITVAQPLRTYTNTERENAPIDSNALFAE